MKYLNFVMKTGLLGCLLGMSFMLLSYKSSPINSSISAQKTSFSPIINNQKSPIKIVVFDVGNVLLKTSMYKMIWQLGPVNVLKYTVLERKNPFKLVKKVNQFIHHWAEKEGFTPTKDLYPTFEGAPLPQSMQEWQKGKITSEQMMQRAYDVFDQSGIECTASEKKILMHSLSLIASPQVQILTKAKISEIIEIAQEIRNQVDEQGNRKFKLVILSNMEKELVPHIKQEFKDIMDLFDDHIFSGEVEMIKPYKEIYDHVIEKHNVQHHECFFIDDLQENIAAAVNSGWHVFHLHKKSSAVQLRTSLRSHGILTVR